LQGPYRPWPMENLPPAAYRFHLYDRNPARAGFFQRETGRLFHYFRKPQARNSTILWDDKHDGR